MPPRQRTKLGKAYRWPGLYSAFPHKARCDCGAPILAGFYAGWPIHFDPDELSMLGELEALLNGTTTWLLVDPHIYRRTALGIAREPKPLAGGVYRKHKCGLPAVSPKGIRGMSVSMVVYDELAGPPF